MVFRVLQLNTDSVYRVLTVHGSVDEIIPVEDALEITKLIPNHKLHVIEGADHGYTSHQAELISTVLDFIRAGLQQGGQKPSQVSLHRSAHISVCSKF